MEQYLEDFKLHTNAPNEMIEKYRNQVPKEMIELWRNYGLGTFMQGYLKSVNPNEFKEVLVESTKDIRIQ
ncbi:hypothetical protein H7H33_18365 [Rossellomorea vietnamensis]|nr:hypothetical protein [Rossellomorea vietnamensis]